MALGYRYVKILRTSPVAGFTQRYGTVSSFAVRVTDDRHTASRGMRRQERRVARNGNETFQQVNSDSSNPAEFDKLHIPCRRWPRGTDRTVFS